MPTLNLHFSSPEAKACADLEESPRHQLSTKLFSLAPPCCVTRTARKKPGISRIPVLVLRRPDPQRRAEAKA